MQKNVGKEDWVAVFKEVGLDDDAMKQWHQIFEKRHPEAHAEFLKWLGLSPDKIANIRTCC